MVLNIFRAIRCPLAEFLPSIIFMYPLLGSSIEFMFETVNHMCSTGSAVLRIFPFRGSLAKYFNFRRSSSKTAVTPSRLIAAGRS